jgi:hypothetical protein
MEGNKEGTLKPSALKILTHLRNNRHRSVPSPELMDLPCIDFGARIGDLRKAGYVITREHVPGKPYSSYRLVLEPQLQGDRHEGQFRF